MMRNLLLVSVVILAILLGLSFGLFTSPEDSGMGTSSGRSETSDSTPSSSAVRSDASTSKPNPTDDGSHRELLPGGPLSDGGPSVLVQVVHGVTGQAVAGATVRFLVRKRGWHSLTRADQGQVLWNPERVLQRVGGNIETDEHGNALVPQLWPTLVTARKGTLFGANRLARDSTTIRVTVLPEKLLIVEVRDANGRPAPGVPVKFRRLPGVVGRSALPRTVPEITATSLVRGGEENWGDQILGITDAAGIVSLRLETMKGMERSPRLIVYLTLSGHKYSAKTVDVSEVGGNPVRLELPRCGTFSVRLVDADGRAIARHALPEPLASIVTWDFKAAAKGHYFDTTLGQQVRVNEEGEARFRHVLIGCFIYFSIQGITDPVAFKGPTIDNPDVVVECNLGERFPALVGTLVGPDNKPLGARQIDLTFQLESEMIETPIRTDKNGTFHAFVPSRLTGKAVAVSAHAAKLCGQLEVRGAMTGIVDVGVVAMRPKPLLVAGRVQRADGKPSSHVVLQYRMGKAWRSVMGIHPTWSGQGEFQFFGIVPEGDLRLVVNTRDFARIAPIEFTRGMRDVWIELSPGGVLRATLVTDAALDWTKLRFELFRADGQQSVKLTNSPRRKMAYPTGGSLVEFVCRGLAPGVYRLCVRAPGSGKPLVEIPDLLVNAGEEASDPRLRDIPVRTARDGR